MGNLNPFRYRGYYYDTETKLYYLQTRYYDPEVGRFISQDSLEYADPETINGLNLYAYCGNNPVMNVDPTGKAWWHWLIGVAIIAAAAVLTVVTAGGFAAAGTAIASVFTATMAPTAASAVFAGAFVGATIFAGVGTVAGGLISVANGGSFVDGAAWGFMIGAAAGAVIGGAWGGAHYALQAAGKMSVKISAQNLKIVQEHINSFEFYEPNNAMLKRLSNVSKVKGADARFFLHELKEAQLMSKGLGYDLAHARALSYYGHNKFGLYAKEVVEMFASEFSRGFFNFWGL